MSGKKNQPTKPPLPKRAKAETPPAETKGRTTRAAAKQVAATRAKLQKAMEDPEFRARVVQQLKGMLRDA